LAKTGFQTAYNNIGLEPKHRVKLCIGNLKFGEMNIPREVMHWQFGEMEFGEMKRNTSNWSNFCILLRRAGLTATAGLSCLTVS